MKSVGCSVYRRVARILCVCVLGGGGGGMRVGSEDANM